MADEIGFDPVAYAVDGGTLDGAALRTAVHDGSEGILTHTDLRVHQLPTAGGQIVIDPGAARILNRSAGGRNQTYVASARQLSKLDVAPNNTNTPRSDLVVVRIEDPEFAPWPAVPEDQAENYQYTRPRVLSPVPATTSRLTDLNLAVPYSGIAVARIDIPANTSAITDAMITDLRRVARPQRERDVQLWVPPNQTVDLPDTNGTRVHFPVLNQPVYVPEWATHAKMVVTLGNILAKGYFTGHVRAELGFGPNMGVQHVATAYSGYHHDPQGEEWNRQTVVIGGELFIPANFRGRDQFIRTGSYGNAGMPGRMTQDPWMTVVTDVEFLEVAD